MSLGYNNSAHIVRWLLGSISLKTGLLR